ncbi:MAG: TatD family hydrolase [Acidimicrobiia bacterium]
MDRAEWVDTHGHLFLLEDDASDVLARARAAGVSWIVCPGIDVASSERSRAISASHPDTVLWSAGLHPHSATDWPNSADRIADLATEADAIGECGLDFYRDLAPRDHQIAAFRAQLDIAETLRKPIIIHCIGSGLGGGRRSISAARLVTQWITCCCSIPTMTGDG